MSWPIKKLGEVLDYEQPTKYLVSSRGYKDEFTTPVLTAGKTFILGNTNEKNGIFPKEKLPVIIFDDFTTATKFVDFPFKVKSSAMKILHAKTDIADTKYLFYLIQAIRFSHKQHKRYWISEYSQLEIPLPPVEEQKRIVEKIENLFAKIDEASHFREESSTDAAALLPSALSKVFLSKFPSQKLSELSEISSGGTPSRNNRNFYKGSISWLKSGELNDNQSIENSEEHITKDALEHSNAKIFPSGTVLLAMYGATAGKLGILKNPSSTNQAIAGIVPNPNLIKNRFLFYFLWHYRDEIVAQAWGGAQPNINQRIIKNLDIPVPTLTEQDKILAYLDSISKMSNELQNIQHETVIDFFALRQSILARVFAQ